MKTFSFTVAAVMATATAANAATVTSTPGSLASFAPPPGVTTTFDGPVPAGFSLALGPGASIVSGSVEGQYAAPYVGPLSTDRDPTSYLAVLGGGSNIATLSSAIGYTSVSLYWGSIDDYNFVDLLDSVGNVFQTIGGAALPPATGDQGNPATNRRVTFTTAGGDPAIFGVSFRSTGNSFELDNVTFAGAVPEPAAWAMMLIGFGFVGAAMRRRRQSVRVSFA